MLSSSSGGFLAIILIFYMVMFLEKNKTKKFLVIMFSTLILALIIILNYNSDFIQLTIFKKLSSGSGIERLFTIYNSIEYLMISPFLGLGWGNITVNDLIFNLLTNVGMLGLISFAILLIGITKGRGKNKSIINNKKITDNIYLGINISFIVFIFIGLITGIEFYLAQFYMLIAFLISGNYLINNKRIQI
jgi:hypothetical protein